MAELAKIEERLDRVAAGNTAVSVSMGGIEFKSMLEVMESAKLMSLAGPAIPKWLQGNPGGCWAVLVQSIEWGFSPIAVARMSYEVNGVVGYMSQLVHAVIEKRAPLKKRLRCEFEGESDKRVCIVTGYIKGEDAPLIYRSPEVGRIAVKNSPLWKSDTDQQLWFYSSRAWCRRYCPDILMGAYAKDELEDGGVGFENARDVTPAKPEIAKRLTGAKGKRGFKSDNIEQAVPAGSPTEPESVSDQQKPSASTPDGASAGMQEEGQAGETAIEFGVPDAFGLGKQAREVGRSLMGTPENSDNWSDAHFEAYRAGWREQDAAMQGVGG